MSHGIVSYCVNCEYYTHTTLAGLDVYQKKSNKKEWKNGEEKKSLSSGDASEKNDIQQCKEIKRDDFVSILYESHNRKIMKFMKYWPHHLINRNWNVW